MTNRKSYGVFIALVLATALCLGIGTQARADGELGRHRPTAAVSNAPKPMPGPYAGEPDFPNGGPLPPKAGSYPTGGGSLMSWWTRIQVAMWTWLAHKRIP